MDQELKQRLIGAVVITALAAIFVPMLFDDPIDETGKTINELKIPEVPSKTQDVEFMPLPDKPEDVVASEQPQAEAVKQSVSAVEEEEPAVVAPKPQTRLGGKEPIPASTPRSAPQTGRANVAAIPADEEPPVAEAEDVSPPSKATKLAAPVLQAPAPVSPVAKLPKPTNNLPEVKAQSPVAVPAPSTPVPKPLSSAEETNRWYLQVGTFSQKPNAVTLQDSLKQQGFAASVKEVATDKGTVFKVRIGPMVDKLKAQGVKAKLAQINVNSFVSPDE